MLRSTAIFVSAPRAAISRKNASGSTAGSGAFTPGARSRPEATHVAAEAPVGLPGGHCPNGDFDGALRVAATHLCDELLRNVLHRLRCRRDLAAEGGDEHIPRPPGGPGS